MGVMAVLNLYLETYGRDDLLPSFPFLVSNVQGYAPMDSDLGREFIGDPATGEMIPGKLSCMVSLYLYLSCAFHLII